MHFFPSLVTPRLLACETQIKHCCEIDFLRLEFTIDLLKWMKVVSALHRYRYVHAIDDSFVNFPVGPGGFDLSQTGTAGGVPAENKAEVNSFQVFASISNDSQIASHCYSVQGICPVLIAQLLKQSGNEFTLFGMPFAMVSTVAIVRSIDHSSTKITYVLEDHTGQIEAHYWLETDGETTNTPALLLNTYAKAYGSIRSSGDTRAIMIFRIDSTNINELTTHLLEVLNARYMAEEYSKNGYKPGETSNNNLTRAVPNFNAPSDSNGNDNASAAAGLKGKHLLIFEAVKTFKSDAGISLAELQNKFSHIPATEMQ